MDFKFYLLTDTHYYSPRLPAYGPGYDAFMDFEQKCYAETAAICDATFAEIAADDFADTVLIAGDLSFNGEKKSHEDLSQKLEELRQGGKRLFVVTAGHDISPDPFCYDGGERESAEGITFGDLPGYYHAFGYDDAIELNEEHLSYVADLNETWRLLVLCNDTAEGNNVPYDDDFFAWIEAQAKRAQADGKKMIAMEHYPVLPGQPLFALIPEMREANADRLVRTLADNGVHLIFTGHIHNQSVNVVTTEKGNRFYDVCTGSVIGWPAFYRKVTLHDDGTVALESVRVPDFDWDTGGKTCEQYLKDQFNRMIYNMVLSMRDDPARFLRKISVGEKPALYRPVHLAGKYLSSVTVGKMCRLLGLRADPGVKDTKFIDAAVDMVRSAFEGDQPFTENTPLGSTVLRLLRLKQPLYKKFTADLHGSQGEALDLYDCVKHTIGNYGLPDGNVTFKLTD